MKKNKLPLKLNRYFHILFLFIFIYFFPKAVFAQESLTVSPAYQEVVLEPQNDSSEFSIFIRNDTKIAESFELFAVEFPSGAQFGSLGFIDFDSSDIKQQPSYISFDTQQFVVDPNTSKEIHATIENRASLKPGGTYLSVIIRSLREKNSSGQTILPAFASQLLIRKTEGEIKNISLKTVSDTDKIISFTIPKTVKLLFENNGNVHLIPRGEVRIDTVFGETISQGIINESSAYVYPDSQKEITVQLSQISKKIPISLITITAFGSANSIEYRAEHSYIYINPYFMGISATLFFLFILYAFKKIKKQPRHETE